MNDIQVAAHKFQLLINYLQRIDIDPEPVARRAHLSCQRVMALAPDEELSAAHYSSLYRETVAAMQALQKPLPWAAGIGSEAFSLMCHCLIGSRTLGEALQVAQRYDKLLYPMIGYRMSLSVDGDIARLHYRIRLDGEPVFAPQDWTRTENLATVARGSGLLAWRSFCGWLIGLTLDVATVHIAGPYVSARYQKRLEDVFHCPVKFGCDENYLEFSADFLSFRLVHNAQSLQQFLDNVVYELIALDRVPRSTSAAIRSLLAADLSQGMPSFAEVARMLHLSESSLRRRLLREQTSFQALKDGVRCAAAIDKLRDPAIKVNELSDWLGFTEPSSFVRSFRSWTGKTPKVYRQTLLDSVSQEN